MPGTVWKAWYMARLAEPPRGPLHRNWLANTMTLGTGRATISSFAKACLPPSIAVSYVAGSADWTRLRLSHLYLMGLGGDHPLSPGADYLTISRMAYHVRHMRSFGAVAFPNYDLDAFCRVDHSGGKRAAGQFVVSEEHFSNIVTAAVRGVPDDRARALTLGLNLMYYCGIKTASLADLRWDGVLDITGSRFIWARGRLICLPSHIEEALRRHRETASPARKVLFDRAALRSLNLYSMLSETVGVLRTVRG